MVGKLVKQAGRKQRVKAWANYRWRGRWIRRGSGCDKRRSR